MATRANLFFYLWPRLSFSGPDILMYGPEMKKKQICTHGPYGPPYNEQIFVTDKRLQLTG